MSIYTNTPGNAPPGSRCGETPSDRTTRLATIRPCNGRLSAKSRKRCWKIAAAPAPRINADYTLVQLSRCPQCASVRGHARRCGYSGASELL